MRIHPRRTTDGQAFLEFTLSLVLLVAPGVMIAKLLVAQWDHTRCLYLVFERTHAARAGEPHPSSSATISLQETDDGFKGDGACGQAHEKVELPKLETARW